MLSYVLLYDLFSQSIGIHLSNHLLDDLNFVRHLLDAGSIGI